MVYLYPILLLLESCLALKTDPRLAKDVVPGKYQGPLATGGKWTDGFEKASKVVSQMTIPELVNLTTGFKGPCEGNTGAVPRLGIPSMCAQDGPTGLRFEDFVSQFPAGQTVAATWDRDLMYQRAAAIGQEFRNRGVHIHLGPDSAPLGRNPLNGRNWEGFGSDAYLSGAATYLSVKGIQDQGVVTCMKHFILYEQERWRNPRLRINGTDQSFIQISSDVDDKTFHELYLPPFAESVRAGSGSMMCSYNSINGTHACENHYILNTILKTELNFQGHVLSDWDATWGPPGNLNAALNGLDVTMPGTGLSEGGDFGLGLIKLVQDGSVPKKRLQDMAIRILAPYYALKQDVNFPKSPTNEPRPFVPSENALVINDNIDSSLFDLGGFEEGFLYEDVPDVRSNHSIIIEKVAAEAITLLKNENGILPLKKSLRRLGIFGSDAGPSPLGLQSCGSDNMCQSKEKPYFWPGTVTLAGGSGTCFASYVITPFEALAARCRSAGIKMDYVLDDAAYSNIAKTAAAAEVAVVFVNAFAMEGFDRDSLKLWNEGEKLIQAVAGNNKHVVVVIHAPSSIDMESFVNHPNVSSIVYAHLPGQESGNSIASVLFGDVNPSGKLPFTIAKKLSDWPPVEASLDRPLQQPNATFSEGQLVDYLWFDHEDIEPRYEFGAGLSYTTFSYSNIECTPRHIADKDAIQETNEQFSGSAGLYDHVYLVTVDVQNTGLVDGKEVAQLYIAFGSGEDNKLPLRKLRGFDKKMVPAGETEKFTFSLRNKDISSWDVVKQTWVPENDIRIYVGSSSRNLHLETGLYRIGS